MSVHVLSFYIAQPTDAPVHKEGNNLSQGECLSIFHLILIHLAFAAPQQEVPEAEDTTVVENSMCYLFPFKSALTFYKVQEQNNMMVDGGEEEGESECLH